MTASPLPTDALRGGQLTAAISNAVVNTVADYIGRGPTRTKTVIRDDLVVCLMRDTFTRAEQSLIAAGQGQIVLDTRRALHQAIREDLVGAVEQLTTRRVIAFMSDDHIDPDVSTATFLLEPEGFDPTDTGEAGPTVNAVRRAPRALPL